MQEPEQIAVEVNRRTMGGKSPAKTDSRTLPITTMGLIIIFLFTSAYILETRPVLALLGEPVLEDSD